MRLGFLGAGTISNAVIRGICRGDTAEALGIEVIFVSKRNAQIAAKLAEDFACIKITEDNQQLVDNADLVFVALSGAVCEQALRALQFRADQKLISFVPNPSCAALAEWTGGKLPVLRAVPLPFIAEHKTATPIFPADKDLQALFGATGGFILAEEEKQFNLFMTAGSMMGVYYRFCVLCTSWLSQKGLPEEQSMLYMTRLFKALSEEAAKEGQKGKDFAVLQQEYSTKGGTNELIAKLFEDKGGAEALLAALEEGLARINGK
ncbi:MAG: pyrroline-5-carboxylate reductase [Herbaspirillum sp.]